MFSRIQNLHISQTSVRSGDCSSKFSRIQNLHISQTFNGYGNLVSWFSRIQNLHISQTYLVGRTHYKCLVEFKIYISLKQAKTPTA